MERNNRNRSTTFLLICLPPQSINSIRIYRFNQLDPYSRNTIVKMKGEIRKGKRNKKVEGMTWGPANRRNERAGSGLKRYSGFFKVSLLVGGASWELLKKSTLTSWLKRSWATKKKWSAMRLMWLSISRRRPKDNKYTWREWWEIWEIIFGQAYTQRGGRL